MSDRLPSFGTAGLRAPMGPGPQHMNESLVRRCVAALSEYAQAQLPDASERGVVIAFDGRRNSRAFALAAARTAVAAGLRVHTFDAPQPTPLLAFTARDLAAACAVMVTASHNPAAYNGLKVYWQGGAQIVPPHDAAIAARMPQLDPQALPLADEAQARRAGRWTSLERPAEDAYLTAVRALLPPRSAGSPRLKVAYTAMHGVGGPLTRRLLDAPGVELHEVAGQADPDPDFGGLESPNPEHPQALRQLLALATARGCDVALAHDPDADRLAVAAPRGDGRFRVLSGDEVGALLGDYLLDTGPTQPQPLLVSTVVSGELLRAVCEARGARYEATLTGFRWIAARARQLEREQGLSYRFGYEEAIGYAPGALGDDKDGIAAAALVVELARLEKARGAGLLARLEALYRRHGLYRTRQRSWTLHDPAALAAATQRLRDAPPTTMAGRALTQVTDWRARPEGVDLWIAEAAPQLRVAVRPSGTEPKLKAYLQWREAMPPGASLEDAERRADAHLDELSRELSSLLEAAW